MLYTPRYFEANPSTLKKTSEHQKNVVVYEIPCVTCKKSLCKTVSEDTGA